MKTVILDQSFLWGVAHPNFLLFNLAMSTLLGIHSFTLGFQIYFYRVSYSLFIIIIIIVIIVLHLNLLMYIFLGFLHSLW